MAHVARGEHGGDTGEKRDKNGVERKAIQGPANTGQDNAHQKGEPDMQKKRDEDGNGADRDSVLGKNRKALTQFDQADAQDEGKAGQKDCFVVMHELRQVDANVNHKKERECRDQRRQRGHIRQC